MLLRDDRPVVGVKDGAQFVGVLTPDGIHRALRASLREAAEPDDQALAAPAGSSRRRD